MAPIFAIAIIGAQFLEVFGSIMNRSSSEELMPGNGVQGLTELKQWIRTLVLDFCGKSV
jgi:hypothetical protein